MIFRSSEQVSVMLSVWGSLATESAIWMSLKYSPCLVRPNFIHLYSRNLIYLWLSQIEEVEIVILWKSAWQIMCFTCRNL